MKRSVAMTMVVTMGLPVTVVTQKSQREIEAMRFSTTKLEQADRSTPPGQAALITSARVAAQTPRLR